MTYEHTVQDHKICRSISYSHEAKEKCLKPKKIILECGDGTGTRSFTSSDEGTFQLANVMIDNTCLGKSDVLTKFSSIVNMRRLIDGATVRLKYQLFKVVDGEEPKPLGSWMFEEIDVNINAFETQEESFSFIFCDCIAFSGCSEYFVTVTPIEINGATATVSNGRMAALSQPLEDCFEDKISDLKFKENHSKLKNVMLACGQGNGSVIIREEDEVDPPFEIAHVVLDTSSLIKHNVLIEFSSAIKLDDDSRNIRLQFELFRTCEDRGTVSLGTWSFERTGTLTDLELEKTFDFIFCESEAPSSCCEYFVMVTPIEIEIIDIFADIVVDNARMVALAQSSCELDDYKGSDRKYDSMDCMLKGAMDKEIQLECGDSNGDRTFSSSNEPAFQLAQVNIDTTCFCNPIVNIEFSSIVSFEKLINDGMARLRYELFRACDNKEPISIGVWTSERILSSDDDLGKSTNIFNFTFCDCITCPSCCEYFVTVTPVEISEGSISATVGNGRIAALAQEGDCNQKLIANNLYKSYMSDIEGKLNSTKKDMVLLECGQGTGCRTFTSSEELSFQIAHVTLNNTFVKGSKVLIKFSSIVNLERLVNDGATVRLKYELFRVCDGKRSKFLGNWIFDEVNFRFGSFEKQGESFGFIFCDHIICNECCDYFVRVTPIEIFGATATVGNGRMAAIVNPLCYGLESKHEDFYLKNGVSLSCGRGNGSIVFRNNITSMSGLDPSANIARVAINTDHLTRAKVLIEFSSMIQVSSRVQDLRLQFKLFRVCGKGAASCRGTWEFERTGLDETIGLNQSFDFIFCEDEVSEGCCEYFVTVTPVEIRVTRTTAEVVVDNGRMVALAQSSKGLDVGKAFGIKGRSIDCIEKYSKTKKVVLECGKGTGSRTFRMPRESAFELANVDIDTSCLYDPIVNIEFSSLVSFEGLGTGRLRYELLRVCDDREPVPIGIWTPDLIGISTFDETTNTFNFTFCDCKACSGCCEYFVRVTPIDIAELTVTVSDGRIAALAQEKH
ncbi:DUF4489 domain-containing protein [Wukongibacter baidiensis]|uniref:DUF4489 domain-containing protein n=1 Tax=Wukongibacter baidiensis TaxID=1723361 RepID=UPI003D7F1958